MANFTIKEGGQARAFTAKRLQTPLSGGGVAQWVQEDERRLTTLHATKNGEYKADEEGYYAYSAVNVSVAQADHVSGKGADGNDYTYAVDGDGNLTETKVPTEIRITTPPDYTGPYGDHAYISFDGLTVTAYDGNGQVMQEVPFSELVFPVTEAHYDPDVEPLNNEGYAEPSEEAKARHGEYSTPIPVNDTRVFRVYNDNKAYPQNSYYTEYAIPSDCYIVILSTSNGKTGAFIASMTPRTLTYTLYKTQSHEYIKSGTHKLDRDGTTGHYYIAFGDYGDNIRYSISGMTYSLPSGYHTGDIASDMLDLLFNSTITTSGTSGGVEVPVQWPRTGDGLVLETSFAISVVPGPGTNDGN